MENLEQQIKQLIIDSLNLEDMTVEDIDSSLPLFADGLGLDSIDALELGISLHKCFGVKIEASDVGAREHFHSVATLADFIRAQRG